MHKTIISKEELSKILTQENLIIIDCRFSLADTNGGRNDFKKSHILNAQYAHLDDDLSSPIISGKTGMISDLLNLLYWREPWLLILLALPILLIALNQFQQKRQWAHFADEHLQPWLKAHNHQSNTHRSLPLLALSWLFFVIALAGPRLIDWVPPDQQAKPATLIVVLDLSASMHADDAYPSRQAQAINWFTQSIKNKPE